MIHVEYKKQDNFPHDREIILFDRDAFQSLGDKGLLKVNKIYNVLCPQVFVMECIAPENTDKKSNEELEKDKKSLRRRLKLIENPLVFTGDTNISPVIDIPRGVEYSGILSSEQIARNCIVSKPITMERVTPEKLIAHHNPRVNAFKNNVKTLTETCELYRGDLTTKPLISRAQKSFQQKLGASPSEEELIPFLKVNIACPTFLKGTTVETQTNSLCYKHIERYSIRNGIRSTIRKNKHIFRAQEPNNVAKLALQTVESMPVSW